MSNNDVVTIVPNVFEPSIKYAALLSKGNEGSVGYMNMEEVICTEMKEPYSAGVFLQHKGVSQSYGLLEIPQQAGTQKAEN